MAAPPGSSPTQSGIVRESIGTFPNTFLHFRSRRGAIAGMMASPYSGSSPIGSNGTLIKKPEGTRNGVLSSMTHNHSL